MKKKHWYILGTITALLIMSTKKTFAKATDNNIIRGCDGFGCGSFGASRSGGTRSHIGVDFITTPGQNIFSPIEGEITRYPYPYGSDLSYTGIEIVNKTYKVKIFYVAPTVLIGGEVKAGQKIAVSQNIAAKYGSSMTNHIHVEVYKKVNNTWGLIDPTNLF